MEGKEMQASEKGREVEEKKIEREGVRKKMREREKSGNQGGCHLPVSV